MDESSHTSTQECCEQMESFAAPESCRFLQEIGAALAGM